MTLALVLFLAVSPSKPGDSAPRDAAPAAAKALSTAHEKAVRRLLEVTRAAEMGKQVLQQMAANLQQAVPDAPAGFWNDFVKSAKPEELTDILVAIYGKYLSQKDCEDLVAFYESPLGQKLLGAQPAILQESMQAGQEWGQRLAREVMSKLQNDKSSAPLSKKKK